MTKHSLLLSSVAAIALSGAAFAQNTVDADGVERDVNGVIIVPGEEASVDAMGGQIVVEQGDAEVEVTVDDPVVTVDQAQPVVTVEQAQPEILVTVAEPTVTVEQQAPIITIEQARPEVVVMIPEPTITVVMPAPDVNVDTSEPQIAVVQPEPIVRFVRPEPRITIEESEPRVNVTQAEPEVRVNRADNAAISVETPEPVVNIESEGDGQVLLEDATPVVNIDQAEEPEVLVEQADPNIIVEESEANVIVDPDVNVETGLMVDADPMMAERPAMDFSMFSDFTVGDIVGMDVFGETGNEVGEVDQLIRTADGLAVVVGIGGFLGLGEHDVALSMDRFTAVEAGLILDALSEGELEAMPVWDGVGEPQALDVMVVDLE